MVRREKERNPHALPQFPPSLATPGRNPLSKPTGSSPVPHRRKVLQPNTPMTSLPYAAH